MKNSEKMVKAESLVPTKQKGEELEILGYIKQGYSKADIRQIYASWPIARFRAEWSKAMTIMRKAVADQEQARAEVLLRYNDLYKHAYDIGLLKECRNILDSIAKVQGLTKDGNVNVVNEFITQWK